MGLAARGLRVVSVTVGAGHGAGVPVAAGSRSRGFGKQRAFMKGHRGLYTPPTVSSELRFQGQRVTQCHLHTR